MRSLGPITALVLTACASAAAPSVLMPVRGDTPVERQILQSYQLYASVNASVGSPEIVYSTDRTEDLSRYEAIIRGRMARDLAGVYGHELYAAERVYLLLGSQAGRDIVHVIRLGAFDPQRPDQQSFDGLYAVGPLTYAFDPTSRALLSVSGPVAGEY